MNSWSVSRAQQLCMLSLNSAPLIMAIGVRLFFIDVPSLPTAPTVSETQANSATIILSAEERMFVAKYATIEFDVIVLVTYYWYFFKPPLLTSTSVVAGVKLHRF